MTYMRFKLSTLLIAVAFVTITVGLGTQVYLLKQQVAELKRDVSRLGQSPATTLPARFQLPKQPQQNQKSRFRLLNNETPIDPGIEDGMKAGEWEMQQRLQEHRSRDEIPSPKMTDQRFEEMIRPLPGRSAH